jgi:hypothetical protein
LLLRDRPDAAAEPPGSDFNLANFQPVANVTVEIVGGERAQ